MNRFLAKCVIVTPALFLGSGLASVYALTEDDFKNTGVVLSAPTQFETNATNNNGTVLVQPKGLTVDKVADASAVSTPVKAGEIISYTITLDNIGLLGLSGVALNDSIIPATNLTLSTGDTNGDAVLDGDETWVYTGTYAITQADIDTFGGGDGNINNTVTVSTNEVDSISDSADVPITQVPEYRVTKVVDKPSVASPTTLEYSIEVENIGNQSLSNISLDDTLPDGSSGVLTGPVADIGLADVLDVNEIWTYTVSYAVSQDEIDSGSLLINEVAVTSAETGSSVTSDFAETIITKTPAFQVSKLVDVDNINSPAGLTYSIAIENTGNVTLNNVAPVDVMPDGSVGVLVGPTLDSGIVGALDVGETWDYTASYSATQSDVDAGTDLQNIVNVTTDETGTAIETGSAVTTVTSAPSLVVSKSVDPTTISAPGTLNYSIVVENNGNISLTDVNFVDSLPDGSSGVLTGPVADIGLADVLDVGETWTYTASYVVSQPEIDSGNPLINQVAVTSAETGSTVTSDSAETTISKTPALLISKLVDIDNIDSPGSLTYSIAIENTGNVTLNNVAPLDVMPDGSAGALVGPVVDSGVIGALDVGETWDYTTSYSVTQSDIDAGSDLENAISVTADETGTAIETDSAVTTITSAPNLLVNKSVDAATISMPGSLNYSIVVENSGNVSLTDVILVDTLPDGSLGVLTGPVADIGLADVLDVNETWTYTVSYVVSQVEIDSGNLLVNQIAVTTAETGSTVTTDDAETIVTNSPALQVSKLVDVDNIDSLTTLTYSIAVENTGNATLNNVAPVDVMPDGSAAVLVGPVADSGIIGALDVGETWNYTTSYSVTQSDIDAGTDLENTVSVTTDETGDAIETDNAVTTITVEPNLLVSKSVDTTTLSTPGTLNYSIVVENSGNVSLTDVNLVDSLPDGSNAVLIGPLTDVGIASALDVGETWTYTVAYAVSQEEIDSGNPLINQVAVTSAETGSTVTSDDAETVIAKTPALQVVKSVDVDSINSLANLSYSISVENTGNVTLNNVTFVDVMPDGSTGVLVGPAVDSGIVGALDVGETWDYTTSYNVTQSDIDAGSDLENTVSVTADETVPTVEVDSAVTAITSAPALVVNKSVDAATMNAPGTLNYSIVIENNGNTSLTDVNLVDTLPDGLDAVLIGPLTDTGIAGVLDVGESWEFTTTYRVSQLDIDVGETLINRVDVTTAETAAIVTSDTAQTTLSRSPEFTVAKSVDATSIAQPGALNYEIVVDNTGNTSLTNIVLNDTLPDGSIGVLSGPLADLGTVGVLEVGELWTFTGQYVATQVDIDVGQALVNSVVVTTEEAGSLSDTAVTTVNQTPEISISKLANEVNYTAVDEVLNYTLDIVNSGNVVLNDVVVTDALADPGSLVCPQGTLFTLQPGEQTTCTATRAVIAGDIATTEILNQASVTSTDPSGTEVDADSNSVVVPLLSIPPVATDDIFESPISAVAVTVEGASNDTDANGDLDVSRLNLIAAAATDSDGDGDFDVLIVPGEGTWTVDGTTGEVTFTPLAGFTADPAPISYTVSDATGLVSNEATLTVGYPQTAPIAEDDNKVNTQVPSPTNPTTLNVLTDNGNGVDSDMENDIDVASVAFVSADAVDSDGDGDNDTLVVPGEGSWVVDNTTADVTFTPEAGFLADPTPIEYTVSDGNGLVSNIALITVDYPQTAPIANDDEKLNQPLALPVTVPTLANDTDSENNLDPTSVTLLNPVDDSPVTTLTVEGEGVWDVDIVTGDITFNPESGFIEDPTPVNYTVFDTTGLESNVATVTVSYEEPAALEGIVWLDSDRDGDVGDDELRKSGWRLEVFDSNGNLVATTITDSEGFYSVKGLVPGVFTVNFFNESGVFMDSQSTDGAISAGEVVDLPLPVNPSGIVYDSVSRESVAGVTLNIVNSSGNLISPECLFENQQSQITEDDGLYAFDFILDADASCQSGDEFRLEIANAPSTFRPQFSTLIPQEGAASCGDATLGCAVSSVFESAENESNCTFDSLPTTNACEVQQQPDAPVDSEPTRYFVEFLLEAGDSEVVFNHLPIDALANDAQILLSKFANKRSVSVGSLVEYTISAENTREAPSVDIEIIDAPPAGLSLAENSVRMIRAGVDGEFDTEDDVVQSITADEPSPIRITGIDFEPFEIIRIQYVLRVGVGVVSGEYVNTAVANGPAGVASNTVSATVEVVPDPVLEKATLIGKVFNDRDSDGSQDPAEATGVHLRSDYYGWNSLSLPALPGRNSVRENPADTARIINMPISEDNRFMVVTREGTRISVDNEGNVSEAHVGDKARGLTGQDIRVCTQHTVDSPTNKQGKTLVKGSPEDVLRIVIQNYGVNEEGIPGVRLATVTGLVIETDGYGRYNIPDVDVGDTEFGQNFVLKVDPKTLPLGSRFTTENPYVLRVINDSLNKINFGVLVPESDAYANSRTELCQSAESEPTFQTVEVNLGSVFFDSDNDNVRDDQRGIVLDIVNKLREFGGGQIVIEAHADSRGSAEHNIELAERRAKTIRDILRQNLGNKLMGSISVEVDPAAYTELEQ